MAGYGAPPHPDGIGGPYRAAPHAEVTVSSTTQSEGVARALSSLRPRVNACATQALQDNALAHGTLTATITVGANGEARVVAATTEGLSNAEATCIKHHLMKGDYSQVAGSKVPIVVAHLPQK